MAILNFQKKQGRQHLRYHTYFLSKNLYTSLLLYHLINACARPVPYRKSNAKKEILRLLFFKFCKPKFNSIYVEITFIHHFLNFYVTLAGARHSSVPLSRHTAVNFVIVNHYR